MCFGETGSESGKKTKLVCSHNHMHALLLTVFVSCVLLLVLSCLVCVVILCVFVVLCGHCCFFFSTLDAGLLARSQYSKGPATGHLDTGFSWFPCA